MLSLLETMNLYIYIYIHAKSHWKYHTFDRYYSCGSTKLRHKNSKRY